MNLPQLQTHHGRYHLLQLDNPAKLAAGLGVDLGQVTNQSLLQKITSSIITTAGKDISGLILDHNLGLAAVTYKAQKVGVALKLEESAEETNPIDVPKISENWGISEIVNNYGVVKLELYYHPEEEKSLLKKQFVAEVFDYCRYQQVGLLLQLQLFSPVGEKITAEKFQEHQLTAAQELQRFCDVMALQSPLGALAAATLTAELDVPWLVSLEDIPYAQAKEQLREVMENGAQGCVAGSTLWQEMYQLRRRDKGVDETQVMQFISTVVRDRIIEISRIIGEQSVI